eukprot:7343525-Alexandrium_andersonii.AAC.1
MPHVHRTALEVQLKRPHPPACSPPAHLRRKVGQGASVPASACTRPPSPGPARAPPLRQPLPDAGGCAPAQM